jgi:hypothetical protein
MKYCSECGQQIEGSMKFCPGCGHGVQSYVLASDANTNSNVSRENKNEPNSSDKIDHTFYLDRRGIRVTATRLIIPGKTSHEGFSVYSMANITSIKSETDQSPKIFGVIMILFGLALLIAKYWYNSTLWDISLLNNGWPVIIIVGLVMAIFISPVYHLKIASASGETDALQLNKKQEIDLIVNAINEALIKRG